MNKSFRGQLADGEVAKIKLSTNNGLTGYKIHKLFIVGEDPAADTAEFTVKVFSTYNTRDAAGNLVATADIDFNDPTLLAMAYLDQNSGSNYQPQPLIVFDNVKFNQDIFITNSESASNNTVNYYIELERVKLDKNEATVATLKDMRGRE